MAWKVVAEPQGRNPGALRRKAGEKGWVSDERSENMGGIVIYLQNGSQKQEVSRVAYIRRVSKNPNVDFKTQLAKEVQKAKDAAEHLNGLFAAAGDMA